MIGDRNLDSYSLGKICSEAARAPAGDYIDTGETLRRLLKEGGWRVEKVSNHSIAG